MTQTYLKFPADPDKHILTFGFIKPHAYPHRREIRNMIEESGLEIVKSVDPYFFTRESAEKFYEGHKDQPFYRDLVDAYSEKETQVFIIGGWNAMEKLAKLVGVTWPEQCEPWQIRGRFGTRVPNNAFHRSDSPGAAKREILTVFSREELERLPENYKKVLEEYPLEEFKSE